MWCWEVSIPLLTFNLSVNVFVEFFFLNSGFSYLRRRKWCFPVEIYPSILLQLIYIYTNKMVRMKYTIFEQLDMSVVRIEQKKQTPNKWDLH